MSAANAFVVRAGRRAAALIASRGLQPGDIACIPGAAGGPKGLGLLAFDRLLHREWLPPAQALQLVGASIGAWRMAALAQPDAATAIDRLQHAYIYGQRYSSPPSPSEVAAKCRAIVAALIGDAVFSVRHGVALQIVTARARGVVERSASRGAFVRAVLANALSRHRLGDYFERVIFHAGAAPFLEQPFDRCGLQHVAITAANVTDALLASGTIPLVSRAVRDIAGAPRGSYWDGALVDYHLLIPYAPTGGRVVLYPHFNDYVTPGWLDKHLPWRRAPRGHRWLDDVLLIAPSPAFLATLPDRKLPDRRDFYRYASDHDARERVWTRAVAECERFAEQALEWLLRPDPSRLQPL